MRILPRLGMALAVLLSAAACGEAARETAGASDEGDARPLVVTETEAPDYRIVTAIFTNRDVGDARARIAGRISQLLVREGEVVRKGQLVAVISDSRIDADARAAAAAVTAARANAERAQQDLDRAEKLFAAQAIARAALDSARSDAAATTALLKTAQAQASAAQAVKEQGNVTAAADGKVTRAPVPAGAVVMPGELVVAISAGAQVLRMELPESEGRTLRSGQRLQIVEGGDGAPSKFVTVRQVYPAVTSGRVTIDLDASDVDQGLIGERLRIAAPLGSRRTIVVPETMIVTRYGADYVRLKRAGGAIIEAPVQRGMAVPTETMPNGVEILSGLRPGDEILPPESTS